MQTTGPPHGSAQGASPQFSAASEKLLGKVAPKFDG
jgi:hypothetical protein